MNAILRASLVVGAVATVAASLYCMPAAPLSLGGGDLLGLPQAWQRLEQAEQQRDVLDGVNEVILYRIACKRTIARDVVAGRTTLFEAAAQFEDLNRRLGGYCWSAFRLGHPGDSDEERHCHEVMLFACVEAKYLQPGSEEVVQCQLEEELRSRQAAGPLVLTR